VAYTAAVTQAPHASFRNGGEAADARQYFARPTQYTPNGPRIEAAISGMDPGEFVTVYTYSANQLFEVRRPSDNDSFDILDWTPHGVWDEPTRQALIGGRRGLTKIIGYADEVGKWRELPMPADFGRQVTGTVHYYGKIARNPLTGVVYFGSSQSTSRLWSYDPPTKAWTRLADAPTANGGNGASFEWAADTERLVMYVGDAQRWCIYTPGTDSWANPFNDLGHGAHGILRYHPTHARHLLVGGTSTNTRASLVTSAGVVTQVTDVPDTIAMSTGSWTHAHSAGCWVVKTMGTTPKIYACWPNEALDDVTWVDLGEAPDSALTYPTLIPGYSSDVALIVSTSGLHAWRVPVLDAPGTSAITPAAGVATAGTLTGRSTRRATITAAAGAATAGTLAGIASEPGRSSITAATGVATTSTLVGSARVRASITAAAGVATTSTLSGEVAGAPTLTIRVLDKAEAGSPLASSTGWDCFWYDDATTMAEAVATTPTVSLPGQAADSLGRLVLTLAGSSKGSGEYGFLMFSNGDGSTDQSPPPRSFAALVPVD
jgi:hypothetical protein